MKLIFLFSLLTLTSCSDNNTSCQYSSKYTNLPSMQAADDAMKTEFTEESFNEK